MKFEEALKLLAQKRPELFTIRTHKEVGRKRATSEAVDIETFSFDTNKNDRLVFWATLNGEQIQSRCTQDDLDEIAALLGWEYQVTSEWWEDSYRWVFWVFRIVGGKKETHVSDEFFPTKLEAAKAALVAIIEKELSPRTGEGK